MKSRGGDDGSQGRCDRGGTTRFLLLICSTAFTTSCTRCSSAISRLHQPFRFVLQIPIVGFQAGGGGRERVAPHKVQFVRRVEDKTNPSQDQKANHCKGDWSSWSARLQGMCASVRARECECVRVRTTDPDPFDATLLHNVNVLFCRLRFCCVRAWP